MRPLLLLLTLLGGCEWLTTPVDGAVDPRTPTPKSELHEDLVPAKGTVIRVRKHASTCKDRTFKHQLETYKRASGGKVPARCVSDRQLAQICAIGTCT